MISALKISLWLLGGENSGVGKGRSRETVRRLLRFPDTRHVATTLVAVATRCGTHSAGGMCRIGSSAGKGKEEYLRSFYWVRQMSGGAIY